MCAEIAIKRAGMSAVTDLGRYAAHFGQSLNGAMDQYAAKVANTLVGNELNSPLIELTLANFSMSADFDMLAAVTGADSRIKVNGVDRASWEPFPLLAGDILEIRQAGEGLRTYLSLSGTLQVPTLLGSCAPDTLIGFGVHLTDGLRLHLKVNSPLPRCAWTDMPVIRPGITVPVHGGTPTVPVTDGPDFDDFGTTTDRLFSQTFKVEARSNHIGLRLGGVTPTRSSTGELLSAGVPVGAIEVPSAEELLVLHRGRGVTAGYAVPAVVTTLGLDLLAQVRPGQPVKFEKIDTREAVDRLREQHRSLHHLRERMSVILHRHDFKPAWENPPSSQDHPNTSIATSPTSRSELST